MEFEGLFQHRTCESLITEKETAPVKRARCATSMATPEFPPHTRFPSHQQKPLFSQYTGEEQKHNATGCDQCSSCQIEIGQDRKLIVLSS